VEVLQVRTGPEGGSGGGASGRKTPGSTRIDTETVFIFTARADY
jgi:hypothetical protein